MSRDRQAKPQKVSKVRKQYVELDGWTSMERWDEMTVTTARAPKNAMTSM